MQSRIDRASIGRSHRRRLLAACAATLVAIVAAGCGSGASGGGSASHTSGTPEIVTGAQVITSCVHNYFYNGILPQSAARTNCSSCVEQKLRKLGIQAAAGETEVDVLTGVRLSSAAVSSLQSACDEADASSQ